MKTDKEIILDIVSQAFAKSPRFIAILKKGKTEKRIRVMASYAYHIVKKQNGVYLSKDKSTVIFYYTKKNFKRTLKDWLRYFRAYLICIKPAKTLSTLKAEKNIQKLRSNLPDYIYVWILGSDPSRTSIKGLAEIRDHLNKTSTEKNLPILIETTVEKVLKLYKFVGFKIYETFFDETIQMPVYLLEKNIPNSQGNK